MGYIPPSKLPHYKKRTVIIQLITKEIYNQYRLPQDLSCFICPACKGREFKHHSKYSKYHYTDSVIIHVLKCQTCKKHHALIPSFSLPGTSLGTEEVEQYIIDRHKGVSRGKAGAVLLEKGISFKHLSYIERLIKKCKLRFEALISLPQKTKEFSQGFILLRNLLCLENRINAVFCNRANILIFHKRKPGRIYSNDMGSTAPPTPALDSS